MNYNELMKLYRAEKNSNALINLDKNFYDLIKSSINLLSGEELNSFKKLFFNFYFLREKKILMKCLSCIELNAFDVDNLIDFEKNLFQEIISSLKQKRIVLSMFFNEKKELNASGSSSLEKENLVNAINDSSLIQAKKKEITNNTIALNKFKLRILKELPEFKGFNGDSFGPFKSGSIIELPEKIALLLIKRGFALKE